MPHTRHGDKEHSSNSSNNSKTDDSMMFGDVEELSDEPSIKIHGRAGRMSFRRSEEEQDCQGDYQNHEDDGDADSETSPTSDVSSLISPTSAVSRQMWGDSDSVSHRSDNEPESVTLNTTVKTWLSNPRRQAIFFLDTPTKRYLVVSVSPMDETADFNSQPVVPPAHTPDIYSLVRNGILFLTWLVLSTRACFI